MCLSEIEISCFDIELEFHFYLFLPENLMGSALEDQPAPFSGLLQQEYILFLIYYIILYICLIIHSQIIANTCQPSLNHLRQTEKKDLQ